MDLVFCLLLCLFSSFISAGPIGSIEGNKALSLASENVGETGYAVSCVSVSPHLQVEATLLPPSIMARTASANFHSTTMRRLRSVLMLASGINVILMVLLNALVPISMWAAARTVFVEILLRTP